MRALLTQAANYFSLTLLGDPTFGWHDRSIGSRVQGGDGERWLRVVTSHSIWANLTAPALYLLDWEGWGSAPADYDAATLYCCSPLAPNAARRVYETFADILDTPDGARVQLHVIGRLLLRVNGGDYPDLANPLHRHAQHLISKQSACQQRTRSSSVHSSRWFS